MIPRHLILAVAVMLVIVLSMGIYLSHMRRSADEMQRLATDTRPVAAPASGPTETVTLYVADDAIGALRSQSAQILRALLRVYQQPDSPHPLAPAAEIRSIYLIDPGAAVIDLNAAFADQHRSSILGEQLTVNSLVETLAANVPGINRVRILVDGNTRETLAGHADLSEFFDVNAVGQAVTQGGQ